MPRRFFFGSLLFGIETVCWAEVAQELNDFVEAVLTNVCADAEHLADHRVRDVVAQVDQSKQHFLVGEELASSAAAGAALSARLCGLLCSSPGNKFRQHGSEKLAKSSRFEAQQGADTIFGKGLQLLKVHNTIFGRH